jgi:thiol:disulfide interchange protein DsbD
METLKNILGFFLLATVLWLFSVLSSLAGANAVMQALAALLGTSLAAWAWGRWSGPEFSSRVRAITRVVATAIFASSIAVALFAMPATDDAREAGETVKANTTTATAITDTPYTTTSEPAAADSGLPWQPYNAQLLADLRAKNIPVFIDFGADWCLSCKANEFAVLKRKTVVGEFTKRSVVALKADWTRSDPAITEALASYGRSSVPLYLLFVPSRDKPLILPEILTVPIVIKALGEIR